MTAPDRILVKYLFGVVIGIVVVSLVRIGVFPMLGVPDALSGSLSGAGLMGVVVAGLMRGAIVEAYAAGQASSADAG